MPPTIWFNVSHDVNQSNRHWRTQWKSRHLRLQIISFDRIHHCLHMSVCNPHFADGDSKEGGHITSVVQQVYSKTLGMKEFRLITTSTRSSSRSLVLSTRLLLNIYLLPAYAHSYKPTPSCARVTFQSLSSLSGLRLVWTSTDSLQQPPRTSA